MIQPGWTAQAKLDFLMGVHRPEDVYKIALYTGRADLNSLTRTYTTQGEVKGKGYQAGGKILKGYDANIEGVSAYLNFSEPVVWPVATITARGALIYNASKDNAAMLILAFPEDISSTNGKFLVPMPKNSISTALFRMI